MAITRPFRAAFASWLRKRRLDASRLERRVSILVDRHAWERDAPPTRYGQQLRRHLGEHGATMGLSCSPYGDWVWLSLRGGPWLPPGYRVRRPFGTPRELIEPDPPDVITPRGDEFVVTPLGGFEGPSSPFGEALSLSRAESVEPEEIAWHSINIPAELDDDLQPVFDYADACLADAERWASAMALWRRSHRYR